VEIREASAADIQTVRELFGEYTAGLGVDLCFQRFDEELAGLPGPYAPPGGQLFVAWDGQTPAGCVASRPLGESRCELKRLYVRPAFRGVGLGRLLANRALAEAEAAGYETAYLDTLPSMAEAIALYRALGFVPTEPYCHNAVPGALFFARPLRAGEVRE
jgi:putative acetyltransferase